MKRLIKFLSLAIVLVFSSSIIGQNWDLPNPSNGVKSSSQVLGSNIVWDLDFMPSNRITVESPQRLYANGYNGNFVSKNRLAKYQAGYFRFKMNSDFHLGGAGLSDAFFYGGYYDIYASIQYGITWKMLDNGPEFKFGPNVIYHNKAKNAEGEFVKRTQLTLEEREAFDNQEYTFEVGREFKDGRWQVYAQVISGYNISTGETFTINSEKFYMNDVMYGRGELYIDGTLGSKDGYVEILENNIGFPLRNEYSYNHIPVQEYGTNTGNWNVEVKGGSSMFNLVATGSIPTEGFWSKTVINPHNSDDKLYIAGYKGLSVEWDPTSYDVARVNPNDHGDDVRSTGYNGYFYSKNRLPQYRDGHVSFRIISEGNAGFKFGLSDEVGQKINGSDPDYHIHYKHSDDINRKSIQFYLGGANKVYQFNNNDTYRNVDILDGDLFIIGRRNSDTEDAEMYIQWWRGDKMVVDEFSVKPDFVETKILRIDGGTFRPETYISDISCSFATPVEMSNIDIQYGDCDALNKASVNFDPIGGSEDLNVNWNGVDPNDLKLGKTYVANITDNRFVNETYSLDAQFTAGHRVTWDPASYDPERFGFEGNKVGHHGYNAAFYSNEVLAGEETWMSWRMDKTSFPFYFGMTDVNNTTVLNAAKPQFYVNFIHNRNNLPYQRLLVNIGGGDVTIYEKDFEIKPQDEFFMGRRKNADDAFEIYFQWMRGGEVIKELSRVIAGAENMELKIDGNMSWPDSYVWDIKAKACEFSVDLETERIDLEDLTECSAPEDLPYNGSATFSIIQSNGVATAKLTGPESYTDTKSGIEGGIILFTGLNAGDYSVELIDEEGKDNFHTFTIKDERTYVSADFVSATDITCYEDAKVVFEGTDGVGPEYSLTWDIKDGDDIVASGSGMEFTMDVAGDFTLEGIVIDLGDDEACPSPVSIPFTVNSENKERIEGASINLAEKNCSNGQHTFSMSNLPSDGSYTYNWTIRDSNSGTMIKRSHKNRTWSTKYSGSYSLRVVVTDLSGKYCRLVHGPEIIEATSEDVSVSPTFDVLNCSTAVVNVNPSASVSNISIRAFNMSTNRSVNFASALAIQQIPAGLYRDIKIIGEDANGCQDEFKAINLDLGGSSSIDVVFTSDQPEFCDQYGTVQVNVSGDYAGGRITWAISKNGRNVKNLVTNQRVNSSHSSRQYPGEIQHFVTITDRNGCVSTFKDDQVLEATTPVEFNIEVSRDENCNNLGLLETSNLSGFNSVRGGFTRMWYAGDDREYDKNTEGVFRGIGFEAGVHDVKVELYKWLAGDDFCKTSITETVLVEDDCPNRSGEEEDINALFEEENDAKIYPNPTEGMLSVEFNSFIENAEIRIYTMDGRLIKNQVLDNNITDVNIYDFEQGLYMYQIISSEGVFKSGRIVKL